MDNLIVKYLIAEGMQHNWEVYIDGCLVGYVHCSGDGEDFGGSFPGADSFGADQMWDAVQEKCMHDLADLYLIDRMEEIEQYSNNLENMEY